MMTGTTVEKKVMSIYHNRLPNNALSDLVYENLAHCPWPKYTTEELELFRALSATYSPSLVEERCKTLGAAKDELWNSLLRRPIRKGNKSITVGGSTDVGDVSWITPTVNLTVTCCPIIVDGHSWQACAAYGSTAAAKGMTRAAQVMAWSAYDLLTTRQDVLGKAKKELQQDRNGRSYTPIPQDMLPSFDNL